MILLTCESCRSLHSILPFVMRSFSYALNSLSPAIRSPPKDTVKMSSLTNGNHNSQLCFFCFYLYTCRKWQFLQALLYGWRCACDADCFDSLKDCTSSESVSAGNSTFHSLHCVCSFLLIHIFVLLIKIFV